MTPSDRDREHATPDDLSDAEGAAENPAEGPAESPAEGSAESADATVEPSAETGVEASTETGVEASAEESTEAGAGGYVAEGPDVVVAGSAPHPVAPEEDDDIDREPFAELDNPERGARRFWRGTGRAATGAVITAAAGAAVLLLNAAPLPSYSVTPPSVTVDTVNHGQRTIVCNGGFGWLGADTNRPNTVVPTGKADVTAHGGQANRATMKDGEADAAPTVFTAAAGSPVTAAQTQTLATEDLSGFAATGCSEPLSDQWLVGASTALGHAATLTVTNPGQRPATVSVGVFHEEGLSSDGQRTGLLVPPGASRSISLNGLAPARKSIVAHVQSSGTAVTATLSTAHTVDIYPQGLDVLTSQAAPNQRLVITGLTSQNKAGDTDADTHEYRTLRLLNTGETKTEAVVTALRADGAASEVARVSLAPGKVIDTELKNYPGDATALLIDADQPLVGAGLGHSMAAGKTDFGWFAASPTLRGDTALTVVPGGQLTVANPNDRSATVTLTDVNDSKKVTTATLPPRSAKVVNAPGATVRLEADELVSAGVRVVGDAKLAAYPVLPLTDRAETLTVYPK